MHRFDRPHHIQAIFDVRGMARLAEYLNLKRSTLATWKDIPPEYVLRIEEFTGVSRYAQRPDVFGPSPTEGTAE